MQPNTNASTVTSWPRIWDATPSTIDARDARRLINTAAARRIQMQDALATVRTSQGLRAGRRLQRRYLMSFGSKLAATSEAWQAKIGPLGGCTDEEAAEIVASARDLSPWHPTNERALAWPKLKRDGERYRLLHTFKLRQTALDKLAVSAARPFPTLLPVQFNQRGGGISKLEAWLTSHMPKTQTVMTVDIPSCFDVLRRSNVETSLFLPKQVVEAAMFQPMDNAIRLFGDLEGIPPKDTHDVGTSAAKRGVPQGSALAQLAADIEIDKVLRAVAAVHASVHVAAYGDNLIFLLEDAGWAGSVKNALTNATTKIFGADVTTALVYRISVDKPRDFEFCRRHYSWRKAVLKTHLPSGYVDEYAIKIMIRISEAFASKDRERLERCRESIISFVAHHPPAKENFLECIHLFNRLDQYLSMLP